MRSKYMIRVDLEGVTGVVSYDQVMPHAPEYDEGRRLFMGDLLALIEGLREGGAGELVLYDEHYHGRNVDVTRLPADVSVIAGRAPFRRDWAGGVDSSFAGLILLGFHAKAGTPGGMLAHTYEHDIADLLLCGVSVGEIGMEAAIAGDYGVATQMVVADSAGVTEAEVLLPGILGVAVKESVGETSARCLPSCTTGEMIRSAARGMVREPREVAPYRAGTDVTLDVALAEGPYLDSMRRHFSDRMVDRYTVRLNGRSATEVWGDYWTLKLETRARANLSSTSDIREEPGEGH